MLIWRIGQFPEVEHLDARGRAAVLRRVRWWVYPLMFLLSAGAAVIAFIVLSFPVYLLCGLIVGVDPPPSIVFAVGPAFAFVATWMAQIHTIRFALREEIQRLAREGSSPFCLACGYDLRGSPGPRCFECGEPIFGRIGQ